MDVPTSFSFIAVIVSVFALFASTLLGMRQIRLLRQANHIPAVVELLGEFRNPDFHRKHRYVAEKLQAENPNPNLVGVLDLPEAAQSAVIDVAYYYSLFAWLIVFGVVDEARVLALLRFRILTIWTAIEPYAEAERAMRYGANGRYLFKTLEDLADRASTVPDDALISDLLYRRKQNWKRWRRRNSRGRSS